MQELARISAVLVAMLVGIGIAAGDEPPVLKSVTAKAALTKYESAMADAHAAYLRASRSAKGALLTELQASLEAAMKYQNVDDAKAVDALIRTTRAELDTLNFKPFQVDVAADQDWQRFSTMSPGVYRFAAEGSWTFNTRRATMFGPAGPEAKDADGALEGRVGQQTFYLGASREIEIGVEGPLELRMHDSDRAGNAGIVHVKVDRVR